MHPLKFFRRKSALTNRSNSLRKNGFSLIEMAVTLIIIGIILPPMLMLYNHYHQSEIQRTTYTNVLKVTDTLQTFRKMNGRYPCPAPINSNRGNMGHGHEIDFTAAVPCQGPTVTALTPGNCANGICMEQSVRALPNPNVLVGAVPFRELQLDEKEVLDAYGSRLVYAVTQSMTVSATFNDNNGAIAIRDSDAPTADSLVEPDGSAAYIVLSHGPDQAGGYNAQGILIQACTGTGMDRENCNEGFETGTTASPDSIYVSQFRNAALGANFFDDLVSYFSQISTPTWKRIQSSPEDIEDLSPSFVGVGPDVTNPGVEFHISATASTDSLGVYGNDGTDGRILADQFCDENGLNCFRPEKIGGDASVSGGMQCPTGEYMLGIEGNDAKCGDIVVKCDQDVTRPVLTGIDASGNPICDVAPMASCPATLRTECSADDISLPAAPDTTITGYYSVGACRQARFRCYNGTWVLQDSSGYCSFTPTTTNETKSCGPGYGGATYTKTTTTACNGDPVITDTKATDCGSACVGETVTEYITCEELYGTGWTGTARRNVYYEPPACEPNDPGWNDSACTCTVPPVTTKWVANGSCPAGYLPNPDGPLKEQTFNTATCQWQDTGNTTSDCTCNATPTLLVLPHVCDDPVCEEPNPVDQDKFQINIDPATCAEITPYTLVHEGSCKPRAFRWSEVGTSGSTATSLPPSPNYVFNGCSCSDHTSTTTSTKNCFYASDPSKTIYKCKCI